MAQIVIRSLRHSAQVHSREKLGPNLEAYLNTKKMFFSENGQIRGNEVKKVSGEYWTSLYLVTLLNKRNNQIKDFILKIHCGYGSCPTVHVSYQEVSKCLKAYQILKALLANKSAVPEPYIFEPDPIYLGTPFIIMQNEAIIENRLNELIERFATAFAELHNINFQKLNLCIKPPPDEYAFARQWPLYLRNT